MFSVVILYGSKTHLIGMTCRPSPLVMRVMSTFILALGSIVPCGILAEQVIAMSSPGCAKYVQKSMIIFLSQFIVNTLLED